MKRIICTAFVGMLVSTTVFAQQSEEKPSKKAWWKKFTGDPEMVIPESFLNDVTIHTRSPLKNFRPLPQALEFLPYRSDRPKRLSFDEAFRLFDQRVDSSVEPRSISFAVYEKDTERWQVGCMWQPMEPAPLRGLPPAWRMRIAHRCKIIPAESEEVWTLEVEIAAAEEANRAKSPPAGRLSDGEVAYEITPSYSNDSILGVVRLAGYVFARDGEPVAAASTSMRDGRLIFRKSLPEKDRSILAAAAFSLLLIPDWDTLWSIENPPRPGGQWLPR